MGSWFPTWLTVLACIVLAVILIVHASHLVQARGWGRAWHVGHVVMALGMIDMYWPGGDLPVGSQRGEQIFAVLALAAVAAFTVQRVRGHQDWLWFLLAVDFAVMVYMFAMMSHRLELLTVLLAAWSAAQAVGWLSGRLAEEARHEHLDDANPATPAARSHQLSLRITLGLMGLTMAYMLIGMQAGMGGSGGAGGGDDMGGMDMGLSHSAPGQIPTARA